MIVVGIFNDTKDIIGRSLESQPRLGARKDRHGDGNESDDCGKHRTASGHHVIGPPPYGLHFNPKGCVKICNTCDVVGGTPGLPRALLPRRAEAQVLLCRGPTAPKLHVVLRLSIPNGQVDRRRCFRRHHVGGYRGKRGAPKAAPKVPNDNSTNLQRAGEFGQAGRAGGTTRWSSDRASFPAEAAS